MFGGFSLSMLAMNVRRCSIRVSVYRFISYAGSLIYSFELDCCFAGKEICFSQGWPQDLGVICEEYNQFSNWQLQEVAGAAYSLPIATTVAYSYWLNPWAPWWHRDETPDGYSDEE